LEEEIGRIKKSDSTDLILRKIEFRGSIGIDIREYVSSEKYSGWSKNGVRIPLDEWKAFRDLLDKVNDVLEDERQ